jgi:hypothetical protein
MATIREVNGRAEEAQVPFALTDLLDVCSRRSLRRSLYERTIELPMAGSVCGDPREHAAPSLNCRASRPAIFGFGLFLCAYVLGEHQSAADQPRLSANNDYRLTQDLTIAGLSATQ